MLTKAELDDKVVARKIGQLSKKDQDILIFFFSSSYALSSVVPDDTCKKFIELNISTKTNGYMVDPRNVVEAPKGLFYLKLNYFGLLVRKKLLENSNSVIPPSYI